VVLTATKLPLFIVESSILLFSKLKICYITKSTLYTSNMCSMLQLAVKKIGTIYTNSIVNDSVDRSQRILIHSLNSIGSQ
jgi:hypothetical protein